MKYILFPVTITFDIRESPEIFLTVSCSPLYPFITTLFLTRPDSGCPAPLYPIYKLLIISVAICESVFPCLVAILMASSV